MNWLPSVMNVVSAILTVYTVLLIIRIVLTWVSMDHGHPVLRVLHGLTDPYLRWFQRFRFLIWGRLDFSPLAALLVVNFFSSLARLIGIYGEVSVGIVLSILVHLLWDLVSFFLALFGVLAVVRFVALRLRWGVPALWAYLDALLQPVAASLGRVVRPRTFVPYPTTLVFLAVVTLGLWAAGFFLIPLATQLLQSLPF